MLQHYFTISPSLLPSEKIYLVGMNASRRVQSKCSEGNQRQVETMMSRDTVTVSPRLQSPRSSNTHELSSSVWCTQKISYDT